MKIIITDYSEFKPETSNNGGNYSYSTIYTKVGENRYEVSYGTSSELDFCPCCGRFGCADCDPHNDSDYEYVSESELNLLIAKAEADGFVVERR